MRRCAPKKRSAFTTYEDIRLGELVSKYGLENWEFITEKMPKRTVRQCRDRWLNYLSPDVVNSPWTREEDERLFEQVANNGNKWRAMLPAFPGRTDINIKNRWNLLKAHKRRSDKMMKREVAANSKTIDDIFDAHAGPDVDQDLSWMSDQTSSSWDF